MSYEINDYRQKHAYIIEIVCTFDYTKSDNTFKTQYYENLQPINN